MDDIFLYILRGGLFVKKNNTFRDTGISKRKNHDNRQDISINPRIG